MIGPNFRSRDWIGTSLDYYVHTGQMMRVQERAERRFFMFVPEAFE